jgi:hypothetical protein
MLLLLLVAHALADFPLQGDFLAKFKAPGLRLPTGEAIWPWCMSAHCLIHAGFVGILTGNPWLGIAEFVAHGTVDLLKCRGRISFAQDQGLHIGCKVAWWLLA